MLEHGPLDVECFQTEARSPRHCPARADQEFPELQLNLSSLKPGQYLPIRTERAGWIAGLLIGLARSDVADRHLDDT